MREVYRNFQDVAILELYSNSRAYPKDTIHSETSCPDEYVGTSPEAHCHIYTRVALNENSELKTSAFKFPVDPLTSQVIKALEKLGFYSDRSKKHNVLVNREGTHTRIAVVPNHLRIVSATLRRILEQAKISRSDFMEAYQNN